MPGEIDTLFLGLPDNFPEIFVAKSNASLGFEKKDLQVLSVHHLIDAPSF